MGGRHPRIPELVEDASIPMVGDVDEHLQKPCPVALDRIQCGIDLGEHLGDLAASIERYVLGNFDPMGDPSVDDDVGPA